MSIYLNRYRAALLVGRSTQEAFMGQAIPSTHPQVVLRSSYRQLRALLATALVLVAGLSVALVIVADDDQSITTSAKPGQSIEYGNFSPQTGRPLANVAKPDVPKAQSLDYGRFNPQTGRPLGTVATPDVATPSVAKPDESKIAAEIWRAQQAREQGPGGPDESSVAAAIAGR
jgi:hypothetical protein